MIAAALTFVPAYKHMPQAGGDIWAAYLFAFQNEFFSPIGFGDTAGGGGIEFGGRKLRGLSQPMLKMERL